MLCVAVYFSDKKEKAEKIAKENEFSEIDKDLERIFGGENDE